jgi:siroheme synthase
MGAAAAAQIPLTHRRASSALVFITAHQASGSEAADWNKLAGSGATLVIYMPGQNYAAIAAKLKTSGLAGETPCAIISRATTAQQQTYFSRIAELHRSRKLAAPTLLVVGEVVRHADPVTLAQQVVSHISAGNSSVLPAALLTDSPASADFGTNEEPLA